jgi:hypothetical protein
MSGNSCLLVMKPLCDRKTAVQGSVAGEDLPVSTQGDGANQHVDWAGPASVAPAFVYTRLSLSVVGCQ